MRSARQSIHSRPLRGEAIGALVSKRAAKSGRRAPSSWSWRDREVKSSRSCREVRPRRHSQREETMRLKTILAATSLVLLASSAVQAQALRDNWCSDVHIRFFVGGAEGDGFGTIVYNGA